MPVVDFLLTKSAQLTQDTKTTIYLKREDLVHGSAHKTNQVLGQALWPPHGQDRIIAETGARRLPALPPYCLCLFCGFKCRVYMGAKTSNGKKPIFPYGIIDGRQVVPVHNGPLDTLKACNLWLFVTGLVHFIPIRYARHSASHIPSPPSCVNSEKSSVKSSCAVCHREYGLPRCRHHCVGGGSNAIGAFYRFRTA